MRLTDLDPHWFGLHLVRMRFGLTFRCPHCEQRLAIQFKPPIDPDNWLPRITPPWDPQRKIWDREGDTFETLTIKPSIDASGVGHWHGFITNGEIVGGL